MTDPQHPPADGWRGLAWPSEYRAEGDKPPKLVGHFARFGVFNEIDSVIEGRFLERIEPGAFRKTFAENRDRIRLLFQHGRDQTVGEQPIGKITELRSDKAGPYYEAELFPSVPPLVMDGLRAGAYGVSYRFSVVTEDWNPKPARSPENPKGLPERTIREAKVYEFGPVTFPADAGADIAVRSLTDQMTPPPEAPTDEAAETHLEPVGRDEPEPIEAPVKENRTVEYVTREEKASRATELKESLRALAVEHPGVLPADAQSRWDNESAELETLERDIAAWDSRQARLAAYANDPAKVEPVYQPVASFTRKTEEDIYDVSSIYRSAGTPEQRNQKLRDNAMRAAEQLRVPGDRYDQDASRQRLTELLDYRDSDNKELARLVLGTNSPQYREAFNRYVASGGNERGTALAVGVDATGGYSVPVAFDPTIVAIGAHTAVNPYRASCRIETIVGTDTWQALTATAITAAWASEAAAADEQGPTFARPEFVAKRAHAFVTASYEMVQDRPSLPSDLGVLFGEAKDNLEENSFTLGVGTTVYPQGIGLKDAFTRVDSITNDTFAVGDVYAVAAALPIRERMNAAWYLSRAAIMAIQALETTGGQLFSGVNYAATPPPATRANGNTGLTLLGFPVYETPSMTWTPTVDDSTWGVLMNPRNYVILDRVGMSIKVIPDMLNGATPSFPTGEVGIYCFWRGTARVLYANGGRQGAIQ
jgi:HK97 family phage major capsid protein/HK97 family phage prohead protease